MKEFFIFKRRKLSLNIATIKPCDIANGPGVRVSVFVSGCEHHCKECFNQEAWDFTYGHPMDENDLEFIITRLGPEYIAGLSMLGGEPLHPNNLKGVKRILEAVKRFYKDDKSIWMYSGYTWEELTDSQREILKYVDILVDGRFEIAHKVIDLRFRGSTNQRIIDVKKSTKDQIVLWEDDSHYYI